MKNIVRAIACAGLMSIGSVSANAAIIKWTLSDITFIREGFGSSSIFGSFEYDADTNTFSNISLKTGSNFRTLEIDKANSNATAMNFFLPPVGGSAGRLNFASALTDAGGTVALTSGNFNSWTLRPGQFISAPVTTAVPEPASWALMIGGFALTGATMRRRRGTSDAVCA